MTKIPSLRENLSDSVILVAKRGKAEVSLVISLELLMTLEMHN